MHRKAIASFTLLALFTYPVDADDAADRRRPRSVVETKTPLADAAEQRRWEEMSETLQAGADPDAPQADGMTALHWAAQHDHAHAAEQLLAAGAESNTTTHYGIPPLAIACRNGNESLVRHLLDGGADEQAAVPGGETMLMIASRTGRLGPVKRLLAHGADPNARQREGQTALMWAAAAGHADVVDALLTAGADVHRTLKSGMNAMMFAVRNGRVDVVKTLLAAGIDVNDTIEPENNPKGRDPRRGMSPLMFALENGHFELAAMLVNEGADPNDQRSRYAPLHALTWVRKANRGEGIDGDPVPRGSGDLSSLQFARWLVDQGADVNLRLDRGKVGGKAKLNHRGATPFLMAAKTADLPYLQLLVELGADPMTPNHDGCTPMLAAAGIGVTAVNEEAGTEPEVLSTVSYLAELGAELNTVDDNGETVMHGAAYRSYPQVASLLHELGADPHIWHRANQHGWTPHLIAQGYRPGSFKPSPEMIAVIETALIDSGIEPPEIAARGSQPKVDVWAKPEPKEGESDSQSAKDQR